MNCYDATYLDPDDAEPVKNHGPQKLSEHGVSEKLFDAELRYCVVCEHHHIMNAAEREMAKHKAVRLTVNGAPLIACGPHQHNGQQIADAYRRNTHLISRIDRTKVKENLARVGLRILFARGKVTHESMRQQLAKLSNA